MYGVVIIVAAIFTVGFLVTAPRDFPVNKVVTIPEGANLTTVSEMLKREHVIRSAELFRMSVILLSSDRGVQAGDYYLPARESVGYVAYRLVHAKRNILSVKVTIPEGFNVEEISALFDKRFGYFDHDAFASTSKEGYLFPDTYFFLVNTTATSAEAVLEKNFHKKVDPLVTEMAIAGHSENEIITMASLLEAEGKSPTDMAIIAGILWKRIDLGMPLQVDSEKGTYTYKGLPDNPINNPGLVSINAAIHPTDSAYLYYISDKDGVMHYAKTLDEQNANIKKYL